MKSIEIKRGRHYPNFIDWLFGAWISLFEDIAFLKLPESAQYILDQTDQADWNKFYGRLAFRFVKGEIVRLEEWYVWRWVPKQNIYQIAKYKNTGGKMEWFDVVDVPTGEEFILDNGWFTYLLPLSFHFGGSDSNNDGTGGVAPKNIKFYIR
jgi:hypothetical protein